MRLKRVSIVIVAALVAMLMISSCIPKDPVVAATRKFIQFIEEEGEPEGPFTGLYLGEVDQDDVIGSESAGGQELQYQLQGINESGYFFYLDEAPGAFYDHPGKLVVISKGGQAIFEEDTEGWPTINGNIVSPLSDRNLYAKAVIWDKWKYVREIITGIVVDWTQVFFRIKGAVITSGLTPTQNLYAEARDVRDLMSTAFKTIMGTDKVKDVKYLSGAALPNWTAVRAAMDDLFTTKKVTDMTLYFIAHGNTNLMNLGGTTFYANQLRSYILEHSSKRFLIIIESCHSGSWLEGLKSDGVIPSNVEIIITTTTATKGAYPDWDSAGGAVDY
ncbi:C13 family peptidase, partial [Mesotoga sp.]|uniref:C13 family peptidase n=1 Tax=Mesotoga sp. TaxID=2053577 RepID=UPI002BF92BD7